MTMPGPETSGVETVTAAERAIPCTVGVLTFNSVSVLARALDATERFAERIICDGGSTDGTAELARRRGCVVLEQRPELRRQDGSLSDFAGAMNQLLERATQPWFFKVDSDEVPSEELVRELAATLPSERAVDGFVVRMKYVVDGVVMEDASTYPMRQLRVIRRLPGWRYVGIVHEHLDQSGRSIGELAHPLLLPQWPARTLVRRWWRYLMIDVDAVLGKPASERWRTAARQHLKSAKYLAWRNTVVARRGSRPRLPLRYEVMRVVNHLVAVPLLLAAPVVNRARSAWRR